MSSRGQLDFECEEAHTVVTLREGVLRPLSLASDVGETIEGLRRVFGIAASKEEEPPPKEGSPSVDDLKESLKEVRAHLRRLGSALAAGATAILAGLGYKTLHDLFPAPDTDRYLVPAIAAIGAALALTGAGWLTLRFFGAQRQIPLSTDTAGLLGRLGKFDDDERDLRDEIYLRAAQEEGVDSLYAMELNAMRLEKLAQRATDPKRAERYQSQADRLNTKLRTTVLATAAMILERRADRVYRGPQTKIAFASAAAGIVLLFGAADYSKGERDSIALQKSCAEADKAGAKDPCTGVVDFTPKPMPQTSSPDAAAERATLQQARGSLPRRARRVVRRVAGCRRIADAHPALNRPGAGAAKQTAVARCIRAAAPLPRRVRARPGGGQ
jgi:hypothetical protein